MAEGHIYTAASARNWKLETPELESTSYCIHLTCVSHISYRDIVFRSLYGTFESRSIHPDDRCAVYIWNTCKIPAMLMLPNLSTCCSKLDFENIIFQCQKFYIFKFWTDSNSHTKSLLTDTTWVKELGIYVKVKRNENGSFFGGRVNNYTNIINNLSAYDQRRYWSFCIKKKTWQKQWLTV